MFMEGGYGAIEEGVKKIDSTGDIVCPITSIEFRNRLNSMVGVAAKWVKHRATFSYRQ